MTACALVAAVYGALVQGLTADGRDEFDALLEEGIEVPVEDKLEDILALGGEVA